MSQFWFRFLALGQPVLMVYMPGKEKDRPVILHRMMGLLATKKSDCLQSFSQEFPDDSETIFAMNVLLRHYKIQSVTGVGYNTVDGHSIQINCERIKQ